MRTLFDEVRLGGLTLPNRIVMSPMGRCRVGRDGVPGALNAEYYTQRASAGLIITEGTIPSEAGQGHPNMARIQTAGQVAGWRGVTDAVHRAGGRIFVQLLHWGRIGHPDLYGHAPVAPSAVRPAGQANTYAGKKDFPVPEALTRTGIHHTISDFVLAARNAVTAGFDGVELHGANGYLIHQFLSAHTNRRDDEYGGTVANRIRFATQLTEAVAEEIGADRVGIRLSPGGFLNDIQESDYDEVYVELTGALAGIGIAYLHLVVGTDRELTRRIRTGWPGLLVCNPGTGLRPVDETLEAAEGYLRDGVDLLSFAKQFLANPDLPQRLRLAAGLTAPDPATFYTGGARGYTDYPTLSGQERITVSRPVARESGNTMVVFVNRLVLTGPAAELERRYAHVAEFMRSQDGMIRYQLLRSRKDPAVYFNVAEWADREKFDRATGDPEFRARLAPVLEVITGDSHVTDVVLESGDLSHRC